ncbi:hypothetical protein F4604DRAFT_1804361, partial [Suillus subluteus]
SPTSSRPSDKSQLSQVALLLLIASVLVVNNITVTLCEVVVVFLMYSRQRSHNHVIFWPFDSSPASRKPIKIDLVEMSHSFILLSTRRSHNY